MNKQFVDTIVNKIIHESPIDGIEIIKALLELKDKNGKAMFDFTLDDKKNVIIDESSKKVIDNVISLLNVHITEDISYFIELAEINIQDAKELLRDSNWSQEERKELEEEIKEQQEIIKSYKEDIENIKEVIRILRVIKEKHTYIPKERRATYVTTMAADVLRKDLKELLKNNKAITDKSFYEILLNDFNKFEGALESFIRDDGKLVIIPRKHKNGIHQVDNDLFYKDMWNDVRIYFMRTGEEGSLTITVLAIMRGHVGGDKADEEYRDRIVSERQARWKRELASNPKMRGLEEAYETFKAFLRKKTFEIESPTIEELANTIKKEIDQEKKKEGKVN